MEDIRKIIICGAGLAGNMTAAALAHILPQDIELTLLDIAGANEADIFYGTVTSPATYDFLLNMGVSEPDLLLKTNTAFSLGTRFVNWGPQKRSWVQSFHIPLPLYNGVDFHHYLTRRHKSTSEPLSLEPYIMSVQAAYKGVFAHPPEGRNIPLASVEFGYQFSPKKWETIFADKVNQSRVKRINGIIKAVQQKEDNVSALSLEDGRVVEADFLIDCSGIGNKVLSHLKSDWMGTRRLRAVATHQPSNTLGDVCRHLTATDYGWTSETALQNGNHRLTLYASQDEDAALQAHGLPDNDAVEVQLGRQTSAWQANYVAIGHSAAIAEPLSPAPMILLQRDIARLIELIPVSKNMMVERREYNRRFADDFSHSDLFHRAFFHGEIQQNTAYWNAASLEPVCDKLVAKITQFESRGVFVQYDYEPFKQQDWAMLHFGMGRRPARYDPLADRIPEAQIEKTLAQMQSAITKMAEKMPPHNVYMSGLLKYLKEKHG